MSRWLQTYHRFQPAEDRGWVGYLKLLRECHLVLACEFYRLEWVDRVRRRKVNADEADQALAVVSAELESCRDILGWEALPECC